MYGMGPGDYMLDPPDDPPMIGCPDCEETGEVEQEEELEHGTVIVRTVECPGCEGRGERYAMPEEIRDFAAERQIERAEARRDDY